MIMVMYIVCKPMDIHGYLDIRWVWIWSDIRTHGYFHGRGNVRLMDLDLDLVLQYPSKPAPLPSLTAPQLTATTPSPLAATVGWRRSRKESQKTKHAGTHGSNCLIQGSAAPHHPLSIRPEDQRREEQRTKHSPDPAAEIWKHAPNYR
jgi:hypothetical protein